MKKAYESPRAQQHSYELREFKYISTESASLGGKKPTYVIDGVRVSRDYFDTVKLKAQMFGSLSCFVTKVIDLGDDRTKVIQYVTATY